MIFRCSCDGSSRPKRVDPYGYHLVGCKIGANAIRLHDEVVAMVAKLFRSLRLFWRTQPKIQICILPIKTSVCKFRYILSIRTYIALSISCVVV